MNDTFYKADLHVHTPASKCYLGDKTENGYWGILRSAVANGVRLIAITDHNTIAGYEKLIELRNNAMQEFNIIQKYNISDEEKRDIQEKVDLFKQVSIIMGVEITLNPGVHIIVLCDEENKDDIDSLLNDLGYSTENRGCDDGNGIVTKMDVNAFLSDERLNGKIVIAPHVDSDKGIWNNLTGTCRAATFKSSAITAITCNNTKQLSKIKELTRNDPTYKRSKPFVCINASDAHKQSTIGTKYSYFKMSVFSFDDLKKAFDSPEDSISDTEKQDFIDYVKRCAEFKSTICVNDIKKLEMACYAILNINSGCILLGITEEYQQYGIPQSCEEIEKTVSQILNKIKSYNDMRYATFKCNTEQLGNGKSIGVVVIESEGSRLWINNANELYVYDATSGYKLAEIKEIEEIIRKRIITDLQDFEERNNDNIQDAMVKMRRVLNPISKYVLYDKFNFISVPITYYFEIKPVTKNYESTYPINIPINGMDHGNVYYTDPYPQRLEDSFLRYSCPVYQNDNEEYLLSLFEIKSPVVVITFGGGCHIIDTHEKSYFEGQSPAILLIPNDKFKESNLSLYHIIAWLKSDCFLWTCIQKRNNIALFYPEVLFNCIIPYKKEYYELETIEEKVKDILSLENNFLKQTQNASMNNEEFTKICNKHNKDVEKLSSEIETIVKDFFEITEDEKDMIYNELVDANIFQADLSEQENNTKASELTCV